MSATWTMQDLPDKKILLITFSGVINPEDSQKVVDELASRHLDPTKTGILIDHRAATYELGTIDIYDLPSTYSNVEGASQFPVAIVYEHIGPDERFYETVCHNRSYSRINVFDDYDQAMDWLTRNVAQE